MVIGLRCVRQSAPSKDYPPPFRIACATFRQCLCVLINRRFGDHTIFLSICQLHAGVQPIYCAFMLVTLRRISQREKNMRGVSGFQMARKGTTVAAGRTAVERPMSKVSPRLKRALGIVHNTVRTML